jgi:hypothetical protein
MGKHRTCLSVRGRDSAEECSGYIWNDDEIRNYGRNGPESGVDVGILFDMIATRVGGSHVMSMVDGPFGRPEEKTSVIGNVGR